LKGLNIGSYTDIDATQNGDEPGTRKAPRIGSKTLEANHASLIAKRFEKSHDFDPYFRHISGMFDAANASSLLMSSLSIDNSIGLNLEITDQKRLRHGALEMTVEPTALEV
jgi:hypothetical protein